jgi:hypothetical protein
MTRTYLWPKVCIITCICLFFSPDLTSGLVAHDTLVILIHSPGSNFFTFPSSKLPIFNLKFFTLFFFFSHWLPVSVDVLFLFWVSASHNSQQHSACMYAVCCTAMCTLRPYKAEGWGRGGGGKGGLDRTGRHYINIARIVL